jgi:hypothetical protein
MGAGAESEPMKIENEAEWWNAADQVAARLPHYLKQFGLKWKHETYLTAKRLKDQHAAWSLFQQIWQDLPDNRSIRHGVFFDLCDVCSEGMSGFAKDGG